MTASCSWPTHVCVHVCMCTVPGHIYCAGAQHTTYLPFHTFTPQNEKTWLSVDACLRDESEQAACVTTCCHRSLTPRFSPARHVTSSELSACTSHDPVFPATFWFFCSFRLVAAVSAFIVCSSLILASIFSPSPPSCKHVICDQSLTACFHLLSHVL